MLRRFRPLCRRWTLAFALLAAGCAAPGIAPPGDAVDPAAPVTVAVLVPTGSADPAREALGQSLRNAAELAAGDVSGAQLDLRFYPTAGDPARAAEAAGQAVAEGASVILGPLFAASTRAVAPAAAEVGVPVLSLSNTPGVAGGGVYTLGTAQESATARIVRHGVGQGRMRFAIVSPSGPEGDLAAAGAARAVAGAGAAVGLTASYPFSVQGITETVPKIARQVRAVGADAVILTDGPTGGLALVGETLRGLGVRQDAVAFLGVQRWDVSAQAIAQPSLQGGRFPGPDAGVFTAFQDRYRAAYGTAPHPLAGLAFDGVAAIGALVAEAARDGSGQPFAPDRLTQPGGFAGVQGIFRLTPDGRADRSLAVYEVIDGRAVQIDPAPRSFGVGGA
ncbi:MAG: penicillin-binding protein activator [Pseudomonadota bacterium]